MNGGLQIGDYDSKDAQGGINCEDIFNASLMFGQINQFNLHGRQGTLLSSLMATGTISRMSM